MSASPQTTDYAPTMASTPYTSPDAASAARDMDEAQRLALLGRAPLEGEQYRDRGRIEFAEVVEVDLAFSRQRQRRRRAQAPILRWRK